MVMKKVRWSPRLSPWLQDMEFRLYIGLKGIQGYYHRSLRASIDPLIKGIRSQGHRQRTVGRCIGHSFNRETTGYKISPSYRNCKFLTTYLAIPPGQIKRWTEITTGYNDLSTDYDEVFNQTSTITKTGYQRIILSTFNNFYELQFRLQDLYHDYPRALVPYDYLYPSIYIPFHFSMYLGVHY